MPPARTCPATGDVQRRVAEVILRADGRPQQIDDKDVVDEPIRPWPSVVPRAVKKNARILLGLPGLVRQLDEAARRFPVRHLAYQPLTRLVGHDVGVDDAAIAMEIGDLFRRRFGLSKKGPLALILRHLSIPSLIFEVPRRPLRPHAIHMQPGIDLPRINMASFTLSGAPV